MNRRTANTSPRKGMAKSDVLVVLAVVGIVIVLAVAIFLPRLPGPGGNARLSQCLTNLRQVGLGLIIYSAGNKGLVPIASSPGEGGWVRVAAQQSGLLRKAHARSADANELPMGKWEIFHCPQRTEKATNTFLDYVSNGLDAKGPDASGLWGDPRGRKHLKLGATIRPAEVVLLAEAEREQEVVDFNGTPSVRTARERWAAGPPSWDQGGVHAMTVWKGGHLPQGKNSVNVDEKPGPRMVARGMHLRGSLARSGFLFQDGHVEARRLFARQNDVGQYEEWLRAFGVKDPKGVAERDDDLY